MQEKSRPFWSFSLRVYAAPGVESSCLAIQDEYGGDVNFLLFCCWQGSLGHRLNKRFLRKAMRAVADWQLQVVQPLRQARRRLNEGYPAMPKKRCKSLRKSIASAELDAEFLEQLLLARCAAENSPAFGKSKPAIAIVANLRGYFDLLELPEENFMQHHAGNLLAACRQFPVA